jgi:YbbR domain-containing protein
VKVPTGKIKSDDTTVIAKAVPVDKNGNKVNDVWLSAKKVAVTASMMETKEVGLDVKTTGTISEDKQLDKIKIPDKVMIRGTKDTLADIASVTAEPVDISGLKETTKIPIQLSLPYGVELASESEDIGVKVVLKDLATLSFEVQTASIDKKGLEKGSSAVITDNAISVTVKGTDAQMEKFNSDNVKYSINLKGLDTGDHEVPVDIKTDDKIYSINAEPEKVKVEISEE